MDFDTGWSLSTQPCPELKQTAGGLWVGALLLPFLCSVNVPIEVLSWLGPGHIPITPVPILGLLLHH